jgi:hypothetical protein
MTRRFAAVILGVAQALPGSLAAVQRPVPPPRIAAEVLRVGGAGDTILGANRVTKAVMAPRGGLFVVQWSEPRVLVLDPAGKLVQLIGREGYGPREFQRVDAIGLRGDSLWAWDGVIRRLTLFSPDFGRSAEYHLGVAVRDPGYTRIGVIGILGDGSAIASPGFTKEGLKAGVPRPILRVGRGGEVFDTLYRLPLHGSILVTERSIWVYSPLGDQPLVEVSPRGDFLLRLDRVASASAAPQSFTLELLGPDGRRISSRSHRYTPIPVPRRVRDSLVEHATTGLGGAANSPERRDARAAVLRQMRLPEFYPPVRSVLIGSDRTIWLRRERDTGGVALWEVTDQLGQPVFSVQIAAALRVLAVGEGTIWAAADDADGITTLVRLRY